MSVPKFHNLKILDVRRETPDCVSVAFEVPPALKDIFDYIPGQYLTLRKEIKGEDIRRSYSICSGKTEPLRVAIKQVEGGKFSTFANTSLRQGDSLDVMTPMGNFHVPLLPGHQNLYVGIAAGSGITPIISLIKAILKTEPGSRFVLFYGNSRFDSIIFREELESLKNKYLGRFSVHHVLSRENLGKNDLFSGRIDKARMASFCNHLFVPTEVNSFFLCGPEALIQDAREVLEERKVPSSAIHYELFTSPTQKTTIAKTPPSQREFDPDLESRVTIQLDGDSFDFTLPFGGDSILDVALKGGADLPFACKGGVCCTCRAKLIEGEVDMDLNYALEPEEVEAGFVLTCQAHPRSARVKLDFDIK